MTAEQLVPRDEVLFLPLGGAGEIGMNASLYGCNGKWILCDLGMTFPDANVPGADLVLPDLAFLEAQRENLLGVVLTHGHEDHIGAIPYLAADLGVPLFATPFTAGLIQRKLEEEGIAGEVKVVQVPIDGEVKLGDFSIRWVPVAHSIAEGSSLVIDTPYGRIFHTGDWKLDAHPVIGTPASPETLRQIGDNHGKGVLALVGDSTNVFNVEASGSEEEVYEGLKKIIAARKDGRVLVTTFASNASRIASLGRIAVETGRRLVVAGRSLDRIIEVAQECGYLQDFPATLSLEAARDVPREKLLIVVTGTQGESRAALARIAAGSHPVRLSAGDLVIYSSKLIPGNEVAVGLVQNRLAEIGVEVIDSRTAPVHVSGHPGQPELAALYGWIRPEIAVPVHGERRHLEAHARLARQKFAVKQVIVPENGDVIRLAPKGPKRIDKVETGRLVVDGDVILSAQAEAIKARRKMAYGGMVVVSLALGKDGALLVPAGVLAPGLALEDSEEAFRQETQQAVTQLFRRRKNESEHRLLDEVKVAVRRVARKWTGKKPAVEVQLLKV